MDSLLVVLSSRSRSELLKLLRRGEARGKGGGGLSDLEVGQLLFNLLLISRCFSTVNALPLKHESGTSNASWLPTFGTDLRFHL